MEAATLDMYDGGQGDHSGACAVCVVVTDTDGSYNLTVANVGDCRAIVARRETGMPP
jgi:serine/threonine protein phosphatase PrpC